MSMRTLLTTLLLSCALTGCIITQYHGLHDIINKNLSVYSQQENIEFNNVAIILKYYSNMINAKRYNTIKELEEDTKEFVKKLGEGNISDNYPVKASRGEVIVVDKFLKDVLSFVRKNEINPRRVQNYINQALKIYVTEIMNYEEKIPQ